MPAAASRALCDFLDASPSAFHAADYMVYAQLQLGRDQDARRVIDEFQSVGHTNAALLCVFKDDE